MDLFVEFAYLESNEYGRSLEDWRLELSGEKVHEAESPEAEES